jgi:hypothetical protein
MEIFDRSLLLICKVGTAFTATSGDTSTHTWPSPRTTGVGPEAQTGGLPSGISFGYNLGGLGRRHGFTMARVRENVARLREEKR